MKDWKFADPENVAVFSTRAVVIERKPIITVFHDDDDGSWQFHHEKEPVEKNAMVVGLSEIIDIDETIKELADLPMGWLAWREAIGTPWHRKKNQGRAV